LQPGSKIGKLCGMKTVRTRIAPSPTGAPHIGTAYIALFNYAFARKHGGEFILRIEDTDQTRSTVEAETAILEALRWAGLSWDEGPDAGGPHGPYRQSERTDIYRQHVEMLVERGAVYPCFCTAERLNELRAEQALEKGGAFGYDGLCAKLSPDEAQRRIAAGEPHVIRMRVPDEGDCVVNDMLREEIRIPWSQVDHQILIKSDGFPTYHLANVVDDHLMEITHVIRGEEWISSTPKHVLLYKHFGWEPPRFAHLPLLRNPDQSKLSKRKNPTGILYYRQAGYLPEALLNYLGLMAYSMPDGREIFSLADFIESFDINRVSLGGPVFDLKKLASFNGSYIRALPPDLLLERLKKWRLNDSAWADVVPLAQPRLETLSDFIPKAAFLFADRLEYSTDSLLGGGQLDVERAARLLTFAQWEFEKPGPWTLDGIKAVFNRLAEKESVKLKALLPPFYVALTGTVVALPLFDSMLTLGCDMVLRRLQYAMDALAGAGYELSGKKLKKLRKEYESIYGGMS